MDSVAAIVSGFSLVPPRAWAVITIKVTLLATTSCSSPRHPEALVGDRLLGEQQPLAFETKGAVGEPGPGTASRVRW